MIEAFVVGALSALVFFVLRFLFGLLIDLFKSNKNKD